MTLMSSISKLTTSVDQLAGEANVTKAQLDAKVAQANEAVVATHVEQAPTEAARDEAAAHATDAATNLAAVKASVTYEGIGAILASKAVTAVEVFVYDTSLDSDGGAWRKRCQHTSWYNEPLNTATRGARREFPAVAVIVAEAAKVTIYDGDDPALPMWMVFLMNIGNGGANKLLNLVCAGGGQTYRACKMLNGVLCVPTAGDQSGYCMATANFLRDGGQSYGFNNVSEYQGNLAQRNAIKGFRTISSAFGAAVSATDVAMIALPDAPVDPVTGLPVPTIAVAASNGVVVIRQYGSSASVIDGKPPQRVVFDPETFHVVYTQSIFNIETAFVHHPNYTNRQIVLTNLAPPGSRIWANGSNGRHVISDGVFSIGGPANTGGTFAGLQRVLLGSTAPLAHAYVTSKYNTGWMPGDIKGAFLADTDDTDLVGAELVTNGTFDNDTDWFLDAGWEISGGKLRSVSGVNGSRAYRSINTVIGCTYQLTATVDEVAGAFFINAVNGSPNGSLNAQTTAALGVRGLTFTATQASMTLVIQDFGSSAVFDSISVKLADADRSVNNKGLIVNGTITRSPVADGAELVAYSGFNDNNFLFRPYHSTLDFGTGDFSVIGWAKGGSLYDVILSYGDPASSGGLKISTDANLETIRLVVGNTTYTYGDGFRGANSGWWHFAVVRQSGVVSLYVNGRLNQSFSAPSSLNGNGANKLQIAKSNLPFPTNAGSDVWTGSLALLRISATAPTPDQIRKIYEDERKLFMPGAQCTLFGTSDAVTALAHDPKTNLLHVGTSAGRSTFDGLLRVANTETPVTTAISAVGGMIAEQ